MINSGNSSSFKTFRRILGHTSRKRKIHFVALFFTKIMIGFWESLTIAWIAGFASWLVNIDKIKANKLYKLIKRFVPGFIPEEPEQLIVWGTLILVSLIIIRNGTRLFSIYLSNRFAILLQTEFGKIIVSDIFSRPYSWFIQKQPSELIQTFNWRSNIGGFLQQYLSLMTKVIVMTALLTTLILYNARVSIPVLGTLSLISVFLYSIVKPSLKRYSRRLKDLKKKVFRETSSSIHGYKDARLLSAEPFLQRRLKRRFDRIISLSLKRRLISAAPSLLLEVLSYIILGSAVVIMISIQKKDLGDVLGLFAMMAVATWRIMPLISNILSQHTSLLASIPFVEHVLDFLEEEKSEIPPQISINKEDIVFESLEADDISFTYNKSSTTVLKSISFKLQRGDKLGIIGLSGSGKTTIVDIVSGLLFPEKGHLRINGKNLDESVAPQWRQSIGYLPQQPYIFPGSINENIAFGVPKGKQDYDRITDSLMAVKLEDVEDRMSSEDNKLIENGKNLSGGQAQRLALARLHYASKDFIIIDEGTSALDAATEKFVLEPLIGKNNDKTMVIITHRTDTLSVCDNIIWLEDGIIKMNDRADRVLSAYRESFST